MSYIYKIVKSIEILKLEISLEKYSGCRMLDNPGNNAGEGWVGVVHPGSGCMRGSHGGNTRK